MTHQDNESTITDEELENIKNFICGYFRIPSNILFGKPDEHDITGELIDG